jgi:hypothetical protein
MSRSFTTAWHNHPSRFTAPRLMFQTYYQSVIEASYESEYHARQEQITDHYRRYGSDPNFALEMRLLMSFIRDYGTLLPDYLPGVSLPPYSIEEIERLARVFDEGREQRARDQEWWEAQQKMIDSQAKLNFVDPKTIRRPDA